MTLDERPAENLLNALQILACADRTGGRVWLSERDAQAIRDRLTRAIAQLAGPVPA